jgi:hypothetical protein
MLELLSPRIICSFISILVDAASLKTFSLLKVISTFPSLFVLTISPMLRGSPERMGFAVVSPAFNRSALPSRPVTFATNTTACFGWIISTGFLAVSTFLSNAIALVCFANSALETDLGAGEAFLLLFIEMMLPAPMGITLSGFC